MRVHVFNEILYILRKRKHFCFNEIHSCLKNSTFAPKFKKQNTIDSTLILRRFCAVNTEFQSSFREMDLSAVIHSIENLIPLNLSESWDNTGLLIEPLDSNLISVIVLTNDLTEPVLEEALENKANMIISYHPPIFSSIKSVKKDRWKDRIVMKCIQKSIAIYSPHTACDAVADGVNDWLIDCFGVTQCNPIKLSVPPSLKHSRQVDISVPIDYDASNLKSIPETDLLEISCNEGFRFLRLMVNSSSLTKCINLISSDNTISLISVMSCEPLPNPSYGMGRVGHLKKVLSIQEAIDMLKSYLSLDHLRVALGNSHKLDSPISSVAVCAGSGSSILRDVTADLYVTGEMSHHDLLDANHKGRTVILCEHSNSERGYLKLLASKLSRKLPKINFVISKSDKDPISII